MIYSPTGAGKTYIGLYIAYCLALGYDHIFVWNVPAARRILYIDGEMDLQTMQRRQREISRGFYPTLPDPGFFRLITPDLQERYTPRINSKDGRGMIEDKIRDAELIFLDNLETLCPSGDEKSTDYWAEVQEWVLDLRRRGIATVFFHHAGKSGTQLGTSKKEHQLYFNLTLRTPRHYQIDEVLKVIARLEKMRGRGRDNFNPAWVQPFEITLHTEWDGNHTKATFLHQPAKQLIRDSAIKMLQAGMHPGDVAADLGLDRYTIYRLKKKIQTDGLAQAAAEE
jgi:putative DNA primase/helicase